MHWDALDIKNNPLKYTEVFHQFIVSILHDELLFMNLCSKFCPLHVHLLESRIMEYAELEGGHQDIWV